MAGGFGGIPLGNIGANTGAQYDPYIRMMQAKMKENQFLHAAEQARRERAEGREFDMMELQSRQRQAELDRAQRAREFGGRMELGRGGLEVERGGLELRGELGRGGLAAQEQDRELRAELGRGGLDVEKAKVKQRGDIAERGFEIDEKRLKMSDDQFQQTFGLKRNEFELTKDVAFKDDARKNRAMELEVEKFELAERVENGQMFQREAQTRLLEIEAERAGMALAEAAEDTGLTPQEWSVLNESLVAGSKPPGEIMGKLQKSPKAQKALDSLSSLMRSAANIAGQKASTQSEKQGIEIAKAQTGIGPEGPVEGWTGGDIVGEGGETIAKSAEVEELNRMSAEGSLGSAGELKLAVYSKLNEIAGKDDKETAKRRKDLNRLLELADEYESSDDLPGDLTPDWWDAALAIIPPAEAARVLFKAVNRARMEAGIGDEGELRDLASKYDIEP